MLKHIFVISIIAAVIIGAFCYHIQARKTLFKRITEEHRNRKKSLYAEHHGLFYDKSLNITDEIYINIRFTQNNPLGGGYYIKVSIINSEKTKYHKVKSFGIDGYFEQSWLTRSLEGPIVNVLIHSKGSNSFGPRYIKRYQITKDYDIISLKNILFEEESKLFTKINNEF